MDEGDAPKKTSAGKRKREMESPLSDFVVHPHGTAMVLSSVNVLVPYHVIHDHKFLRCGVVRELYAGIGLNVEEFIELEVVDECKAEDWSILKRKDSEKFDTKVRIAMEKDLPAERDEIGIRDFPVGLLTSSSTTKLKVSSTHTKVCWYEPRGDKKSDGPFKGIHILAQGTKRKPIKPEAVVRVERGRVVGSCGAPYFWRDLVFAFHFESVNDHDGSSAHSHVSYSMGYVLCRLPKFMKFYNAQNWGI